MKWTFEKLQEEANKCKDRKELRKNSYGAYIESSKKNLLDELFKNHYNSGFSEKRVKNGYWTKEKLQEEANKYLTRTEFWNKNEPAAKAAQKKKLTDKLFKNHPNQGFSQKKKKNGYWTNEKLQEEANKYQTRQQFRENNFTAYQLSCDKKLIDKFFKNKINEGYSDKCKWQDNKYVIYVYELIEFNKAYIGLTNNINRRDKEHLFSEKELLSSFCKEKNISYPNYLILDENLKSNEAKEKESYWINYYKSNNWELFNSAKPGSLGGMSLRWTKKTLQIEVSKYKTRSEFNKNNASAYNAALKKNLIDILFENHPNKGFSEKQKISGYWTKERLQEEANKNKTRTSFRKNLGAYNAARNFNILNDLFKNHHNQGYKIKIKKAR